MKLTWIGPSLLVGIAVSLWLLMGTAGLVVFGLSMVVGFTHGSWSRGRA